MDWSSTNSTITQFNFPNGPSSNQLPTESLFPPGTTAPQPAGSPRHAPATQEIQNKLEQKRRNPLEDIGSGSKPSKTDLIIERESTNPTPARVQRSRSPDVPVFDKAWRLAICAASDGKRGIAMEELRWRLSD